MSSTSNPRVSICDPDGTPAEVGAGGALKVDIGDNISVTTTVEDVITVDNITACNTGAIAGTVTANQGTAGVANWGVTVSNPISGFATSGGQLAAGHTIDCNDSNVNVTNMISGFATSGGQLAAGHTIDCNGSNVAVTGTVEVVGDVAQGTTASGNPVLIGGKYEDTYETVDDDEVRAIAITRQGSVNTIATISENWGGAGGLNNPVQIASAPYEVTDAGMTAMGLVNHELAPQANVDDGEYAHIQLDETGALYTTHGMTGMTHAALVCGTDANQISADQACKRVDLMGNPGNTGDIYVGGADTIAGSGAMGGIRIQAGDFYSIDIDNLGELWFEATDSGQILNYIYFT